MYCTAWNNLEHCNIVLPNVLRHLGPSHPQVGDRIVAVNGTSGASQAIFDVIKDTQEADTGQWRCGGMGEKLIGGGTNLWFVDKLNGLDEEMQNVCFQLRFKIEDDAN